MKFSLSSLRADGLTEELLGFLRHTGTRSVTLALEGASRRLRVAMNKNFSEGAFLKAVERISRMQFNTLKVSLAHDMGDDASACMQIRDMLTKQSLRPGREIGRASCRERV